MIFFAEVTESVLQHRGATKLLFGPLVVLRWTTKSPNNIFVAPRMLENCLCNFSKKFKEKPPFRAWFFLQNLQSQFYNMWGATKLLFGVMVVHSSTTKCTNNSFLGPRMLENWLCNFCEKIQTRSRPWFFRRSYRLSSPTYAVPQSCYLGIW